MKSTIQTILKSFSKSRRKDKQSKRIKVRAKEALHDKTSNSQRWYSNNQQAYENKCSISQPEKLKLSTIKYFAYQISKSENNDIIYY